MRIDDYSSFVSGVPAATEEFPFREDVAVFEVGGKMPGHYARSTSEDGRVWNRDVTHWDVDSYMPPGRKLDPTNITLDSVRYAVALNISRSRSEHQSISRPAHRTSSRVTGPRA